MTPRIPPLAGLFTHEEAARPGWSVDQAAERLWRLAFVCRRLHAVAVDALPRTPEWEAKGALGLHLWLDAEHAAALATRVDELRHPSVDAGAAPDPRLGRVLDELAHARDTAELLAGGYLVLRAALVEALESYARGCNPLADHPSLRLVESVLGEQRRVLAWVRAAAAAVGPPRDAVWEAGVRALLAAAGGLMGDAAPGPPPPASTLRSAAGPPPADVVVRRDERFGDPFNESADIDAYWDDPARPADERAYALAYKRLRETDVPEWIAPIVAASPESGERRVTLRRQLWDETRHAMMGEVALERQGVPFHAFPIPVQASMALNTRFTPHEAHLMLWTIEQDLMAAATGKRREQRGRRRARGPAARGLPGLRLGRRGRPRAHRSALARRGVRGPRARRGRGPRRAAPLRRGGGGAAGALAAGRVVAGVRDGDAPRGAAPVAGTAHPGRALGSAPGRAGPGRAGPGRARLPQQRPRVEGHAHAVDLPAGDLRPVRDGDRIGVRRVQLEPGDDVAAVGDHHGHLRPVDHLGHPFDALAQVGRATRAAERPGEGHVLGELRLEGVEVAGVPGLEVATHDLCGCHGLHARAATVRTQRHDHTND